MKWVVLVFIALYLGALALLAIGTFGWLGQERDPLSGVFLVPLGLPWNRLAEGLGWGGVVSGMLAPAVNAALLWGLWKGRRRTAG
ncbi:hypothetical protein [Novosphingobium decolorationis]|uniref:Uncharacterized protein n=1 Tax=Novosphingobium decolorationis TaxID=2698673 RepID=A0ABX8E0X1_9SPHN|nr:hypothetical protein [Novosphingobium decolorationis]QVM82752.1 hypothetical protein HT578_02670 [Novosphingobium decolorationis]